MLKKQTFLSGAEVIHLKQAKYVEGKAIKITSLAIYAID